MPAAPPDIPFRPDRAPLVPPGGADLHATDMTATFAADLTLADAQRQLAQINQWLPIDGDPSWALGRLVEVNSTGPLRLGYGAWRDLLLGCQFHTARGDLITAGGRTVKNVAGYDLTKFMVGQAGAFGKLATITTRTYRRPEGVITAWLDPDPAYVGQLLPTALRPQYMMISARGLACGYTGDARTLAFYRDAVRALAPRVVHERSLAEDTATRAAAWAWGSPNSARASVPPTRIMQFIESANWPDACADAAFGIAVGPARDADHARLTTAARAAGGSVYFMSADGTLAGVETPPRVRAILDQLKA
ncbi:MAG: FAD-binding oxidoreductase [Phycisphaerae bacterium]